MRFGGGGHQPQEIQIKDYYRINIYFAVLDIIVKEIIDRFQENELEILDGLMNVFTNENPDEKLLEIVCKTYKFDNHELQVELKIFNRMFKSKQINSNNSLFQNKLDYMKQGEIKDGFPLLSEILKLFMTIPTNTASCERSFSCLRRLKTYLRSTMGQERLSDLAILQIERNRVIDSEIVIDEFNAAATVHGRRLSLI